MTASPQGAAGPGGSAARPGRGWRGHVVVITGGASGIGRGFGEAIAARGGHVVLADRRGEVADEAASAIRAQGGSAEAATLDVTDAPAFEALIERVHRERGRLDALFNNAGIGVFGPVRAFELEHWKRTIDVNLWGVVHGIHAAYRLMVRQGFGRIVNTASAAGLAAFPGVAAYSMTKHAVVGLSLSLRIEAKAHGVTVSALCPGAVRTPILESGGAFGMNLTAMPQEAFEEWWSGIKRPIPVEALIRYALPRIERGDAVIVAPWFMRVMLRLQGWWPTLVHRIIERDYLGALARWPALEQPAPPSTGPRA